MIVRIATVRATGARYIVQQVDFNANKVHVWGEVEAHKARKTTHGPSKHFDRAEVDLAEVEKTDGLVFELFEQGVSAARAEGRQFRIISRRCR